MILQKVWAQRCLPSSSFDTTPGLTSISCPDCSTPRRTLPPATPPFRSSTSDPGLFTSNDRITISLGDEVKLRSGIGILSTTHSQKKRKDDLHVVLELRRGRDDRRALGDGALDELEDGLVLFGRMGPIDKVDLVLVLKDDNVLEPGNNQSTNDRVGLAPG